jgi:sugar lactone lactonase YvrE
MPSRAARFLPVLAVLAACAPREEAAREDAPPPDSLSVADSFRTPESALHDATMDVYLVSNINGSPFDKDDNGFISRVAPDGRVVELRWIDGADAAVTLHAPKGMAISGDTLFVADIDEVRLFDRISGAPLGSRRVSGARFLNDVAVGPDGTVYVTDTSLRPDFSVGIGVIYRFDRRGRAEPMVAPEGGPNGILADSAGLVVATWDGGVLRIAGGSLTTLPRVAAQLDGLVRLADGTLLVSAWADSSIHRLAPGASAWVRWAGGFPSPADIGFDMRRNRVLIPLFQLDRVEVRPVR